MTNSNNNTKTKTLNMLHYIMLKVISVVKSNENKVHKYK